ncbi:hypothetical protein MRS44_018324 [Fusarium solani]|uniref:uncharacterized protein n=1 Tax=Fusarium solani TaxID=169388 RepID=UPI0032C49958|nr:hypothetical protein MRS44_018324 [Fusarium solani]
MSQSRGRTRNGDRHHDKDLPAGRVGGLQGSAPPPSSVYQQLELNRRQIRILHLLPGNRRDPVHCVLHTAFLDDEPSYEALSYAWGDPLDRRPIMLNGKTTGVTLNLYNAFRRLRRRRYERRLWVDALCINQDDDTEKSHQVNLMRDIYSNTTMAILWLGDYSDSPDPLPAPQNPSSVTNHIPRQIAVAAFAFIKSMATNGHYDRYHDDSDHKASGHDLASNGVGALSCLLQLSWWHRVWTVQEAVLPENATIVCGTIQLALSELVLAYENSLQHHFERCCGPPHILDNFWNQIHGLNIAKNCDKEAYLVALSLNVFRLRNASDPRDRVYAFLGLGSAVQADYSLSHEEAFKLSVRSLIKESGGLVPLLRTAESCRSPDLPTWVPDWCAEFDQDHYDDELGWLYAYDYYAAAGRTEATPRDPPSNMVLDLQGLILDQITEVGDILDTADSMMEVVAEWQDITKHPCQRYPYGGNYKEASWRTLMCDLIWPTSEGHFRRLKSTDDAEAKIRELLTRNKLSQISGYLKKGFTTRTGMIGLGKQDVEVGDVVCILLGGDMPFILRQAEACGNNIIYCKYIGQAYVHGIMDGQIMDEGRDLEWISLV